MHRLLAYYLYSLRHPSLRRYISEGFGIEAREKRSARFWRPHIKCSLEFQRQALADYDSGGAAAILGAGRLYDVDVDLIRSKFQKAILIDIDPSTLRVWEKAFKGFPIEAIFLDLSGSYKSWEASLSRFLSSTKSFDADAITLHLKSLETSFVPLPECGAVLSMNLLGQLPLSWRDFVHEELRAKFSIDSDEKGRLPSPIEEALCETFSRLQSGHLLQISSSSASRAVIITDKSFMYYTRDFADWEFENALHIDPPLKVPGFCAKSTDGWFWHIAPQGVEFKEYGVIHDIAALDLRRESEGYV